MARPLFTIDANLKPEGPITKTANYNGAALDLGAGWAPDPAEPMAVIINSTACDATDGNETYSFAIEESSDNATFTPTGLTVTVTRGTVGNTQGIFGSTKRYVRANLTVGGTTPSITYTPYFGPVA